MVSVTALPCENLITTYHKRLRILNLPTLKFHRQRGDMIETYKILNGIYDKTVTPNIPILLVSYRR